MRASLGMQDVCNVVEGGYIKLRGIVAMSGEVNKNNQSVQMRASLGMHDVWNVVDSDYIELNEIRDMKVKRMQKQPLMKDKTTFFYYSKQLKSQILRR